MISVKGGACAIAATGGRLGYPCGVALRDRCGRYRLPACRCGAAARRRRPRGEDLGIRWQDIDFDSKIIHVRQQIYRSGGELHIGPVKTRAGSRDLPLLGLARIALTARQEAQESDRARLGAARADAGLVFTTRTGRPVEPRNLVRSFTRICDHDSVRRIRLHAIRHTTAS
jgi:integrase